MSNPRYMMQPYQAARQVAAHGRFGDSTLVHVNPNELRGLAALSPTGRLSRNPHTGLPEAFDLGSALGLIGGLAGSIFAPELIPGMSAALGGGLGAGIGTVAGSGDLGRGLVSGLLGYGLGSATDLLAEGGQEAAVNAAKEAASRGVENAAIAPAAESATAPYSFADMSGAYGGVGPSESMGLNVSGGLTNEAMNSIQPGSIAAQAAERAGPAASNGMDAYLGRLGQAAQGAQNPGTLWNTFGKHAMSTTVPIGLGAYGTYLQGQSSAPTMPSPMQTAQGYGTPSVPGPNQRKYMPAPSNWDYSTGKEWNYWTPAFADGGGVDDDLSRYIQASPQTKALMDSRFRQGLADSPIPMMYPDSEEDDAQLVQNPAYAEMMAKKRDEQQGGYVMPDYSPFRQPDTREYRFAKGGWIGKAIKHPGAERNAAKAAGMSTHAYMEAHKNSPGKAGARARLGLRLEGMHHYAQGGGVDDEPVVNYANLVAQGARFYHRPVRRPVRGELPQELPKSMGAPNFAGGGGVEGPGSGLDDAIPAVINGRQPARLSSGEYVVPAHAVSALGNGSTQDGVRQLDGMVDNVMMHKFGTTNRKPRPINPRRMMPGGVRGPLTS